MKKILTINVLLLLFVFQALAQKQVTGLVTSTDGDPLPGVSVVIQGTTQGVITDFNGKYQIDNVKSSDTLVYSFVGMISELMAVGNQAVINVSLIEDIQGLDEVVVIGYGTQRKEAVTGSVANVKGDVIREMPSSNVSRALQGRVAGVQMSQSSSKPGSDMQIRIRGTRSLNASNDPLIVLDGIPFAGSLSDISPSNIKSIDILKDASATAIYGSRGANGVLLITTNKGYKGQAAQVTYTQYTGVKSVFGKYPMMDGPTFSKLREDAGLFENSLDESNDVSTDWQDELYRNGSVTNHDLGVSGGTEKAAYNFGVGYYNEQAVLPGQGYERFSLRGSLDQEVNDYIKLGFSTKVNHSISSGDNLGIYGALNSSPLVDPYNEDGTIKRDFSMPQDDQWTYTRETVEELGDSYISQTKATSSYNSVYANVKIPGIEGLSYKFTAGLNYRSVNKGNYQGQGVFSANEAAPSNASITNSLKTSWAIENLLTYDRKFGKHNINLIGLYSSEEESYNSSYASAEDIPSDAFQFYNLGRANVDPIMDPEYQDYYKSGLLSVMGRIMYGYADKYMISISYRADGSSRLSEGNKWVSYPAVSAGWNIAKESFMQNISQINALKLRVGYGVSSNQSIDPYSTLGKLGSKPYNFGSENATGLYVEELKNPEAGWEYTSSWNFALDFTLFNARLSGSVEYYRSKTEDLLFQVNLPQSSGVSSYMANIGESQNNGFELALDGTIIDDKAGFTWDAGLNFYLNRNEITALASGMERDEANWWFVGHPIDVIYDYEYDGLWNENDPDYQFISQYVGDENNPGMIKVKYTGKYNEDGSPVRQIDDNDKQIMSMEPDFVGGFNTSLRYKGFDLGIVASFQKGGLLIATPYGSRGYLNMLSGRRGNIDVDYWTPENTDARYPAAGGAGGDAPSYLNSLSYFDASYFKFRTITLGYTFKQEKLKKIGIDNVRIYATAQNPFVLFSDYNRESGMDPETNAKADDGAASASAFDENQKRLLIIGTNTPSTRNFIFGLNITF